jgi:hypothetical protein
MATETLTAPAVHSAKIATKHALKLKSFMHEKIAAGQLQAQNNAILRQQKLENDKKLKDEKETKEQKIAQKVAKDNKEKTTNSLATLLKK